MNILFLGSCLPKEYENKFANLSAAANQYQNNLISALKKEHDVYLISHIGLKNVSLCAKERKALLSQKIEVFLPKIEGYWNFFKYRKIISAKARNSDCIICYNLIYLWFYLNKLVKKKKCKKVLVLADYTPPEELKGWRKFYSWLMKKQISTFDKIVILSEKSRIFIKDKPFELINGCIDWSSFKDFPVRKRNDEFNIVYTGLLNRVTGVQLLLEAFSKLCNSKYHLILCGQLDKDFAPIIEDFCLSDSRIKFLGYLDKKKYFDVLENADLLINPRDLSFEQNKYNFPSKIIEYLGTGRAVISTKFSGYERYLPYINFCDATSSDISNCIMNVLSKISFDRNIYYIKNRKYIQQYSWENMIEFFL